VRFAGVSVAVLAGLWLAASAHALGVRDGRLAPCPDRPNCVASDAADPARRVEPLVLAASPAAAWEALRALLRSRPDVTVKVDEADYLRAEFRSAVFGFVDDVEFHLRRGGGVIAVRSASRVGYYDFGANRARIEAVRGELRARGAVR
jgi:uncharacterized protein (DUF1499 family)